MQEVAAKRYSKALFEVGKERNLFDDILSQMKSLAEIFSNNREFLDFLNSPNVDEEKKHTLINDVFKDKLSKEVLDLIFLLIKNKRGEEVPDIYEDYRTLLYEYKGIKIAVVTTAVEMTKEEIDLFSQTLSKKYDTKVEVENVVDPSVIGGVSLRIGDEVIDDSIKGRIEKMRKNLYMEDNKN